ncbi:MAG: amidohydrolase family protein [Desulfobacterales bacterium]|nr:amidohydrolase family protein [Desulfobacterales bacterium]
MSETVIVNAGWFIDGTGGPVRKNIRLCIENGKICSISDSGSGDSRKGRVIDFGSGTILPCLVDSHVHLCMSGTDDPVARKKQLSADFDDIKDLISEHIKRHLSYGVLAVRDGGDRYAHVLRYRNEYSDIKKMPIGIRVAGRAWHRAGRYGGLIGRSLQENHSLAEAIKIDHEENDHVKIVNSGLNSLKEFGKETLPQFGAEELSDVVKIAGKCGRRVMVHANGKKPVAAALAAGCNSIEHGFFMGVENLKIMAEKGIVWVPTACTMKAYAEHMKHGSIEYEVSRMNLDHQLEQISKARELGVIVALGTDAGSIGVHHGSAVIDEMGLLIQAGYSLPEAVKCASINGADLTATDDFGILASGKPATFLAVTGDPSKLPGSLSAIQAIYINGTSASGVLKSD